MVADSVGWGQELNLCNSDSGARILKTHDYFILFYLFQHWGNKNTFHFNCLLTVENCKDWV